jgi:hypothetical protein
LQFPLKKGTNNRLLRDSMSWSLREKMHFLQNQCDNPIFAPTFEINAKIFLRENIYKILTLVPGMEVSVVHAEPFAD